MCRPRSHAGAGGLPDGRFHQAPLLPVHRGRARAVARRGSRLEDTRGLRRGSTHSPPTVIFAIFFTGRRGTSAPLESACPKRHPASLMSRRMACKTADAVAVVNAWTGPDATGPGRGKRHHARPRADAAGTMAGLMEQQAMDGGRGGMRGHGACKGAVPTRAGVPM